MKGKEGILEHPTSLDGPLWETRTQHTRVEAWFQVWTRRRQDTPIERVSGRQISPEVEPTYLNEPLTFIERGQNRAYLP